MSNDQTGRRIKGSRTGVLMAEPLDPRIGMLCRVGKPIYYAHIAGIYIEGDRRAVESAVAAQEIPAW